MVTREILMAIPMAAKEILMAIPMAMAARTGTSTMTDTTMTTMVVETNTAMRAIEKERTSTVAEDMALVMMISDTEVVPNANHNLNLKDRTASLISTWVVLLKITMIGDPGRGRGLDQDQETDTVQREMAMVQRKMAMVQRKMTTVHHGKMNLVKEILLKIQTTSRTRSTGARRGKPPRGLKHNPNVHTKSGVHTR